ncbi:MAG: Lrp/AsnC family transcriptional regulator [Bacilli bacterium]
MTKLQEQILKTIKNNSRIDLHDLASMLNVSDVELANEINLLEKNKIICGYQTLINYDNTDEEIVTALIEVKVIPQRDLGYDKIAERIYNFNEVDSIYLMSGAYDFMVLIEGKSMKEVSRFVFDKLATLDSVSSTATHFVLKKYKDHGTKLVDTKKDHREQGNI